MASCIEPRRPSTWLIGRRFVVGLPVIVATGAARGQEGELTFPRSSLVIAAGERDIKFDVELALDDAHRSHGLMFRKKLGPYEGMLFDFFMEMPVSFWMKNTLIPLDMLFIAADGHILNIAERTIPQTETPVPSAGPIKAVLELNGGTSQRLGIKPGDRVRQKSLP